MTTWAPPGQLHDTAAGLAPRRADARPLGMGMIRALLAVCVLTAGLLGRPAAAQQGPLTIAPGSAEQLDGVLRRLTHLHAPPRWCTGECASAFGLEIYGRLGEGRLRFTLRGQVTADLPALVSIFGTRPAAGLATVRLQHGPELDVLWVDDRYAVLLEPGPFVLQGELTVQDPSGLDLFVPGPVGHLAFDVPDAQVLGDRRRRAVSRASYQLVRRVLPQPDAPKEAEAPVSRLRFSVRRSFEFARDRRFEVEARVEGARPGQVVSLALLPGEKVEGTEPEGASVHGGEGARVEFTAQDSSSVFQYFGEWTGDELALSAPEGAVRETWVVGCADPFACTFEGDAEVQPGASGHVWAPLPGQGLKVRWTELEPLPGVHALVQTVRLESHPRGRNLRQGMLATFTASASVLETLHLPEGALITDFSIAGKAAPVLRDATGAITLTLPTGRSEVRAVWEIVDAAGGPLHRPPVPRFSVPVGTVRHAFFPPEERSVLWAGGLQGSPEVTLWPALVTCALLALLLLWLLRRLPAPADRALAGARLWLPTALGFALLSPYALLPLLFVVAGIRWMEAGGSARNGLRVVAELLILVGVALGAVIASFAVLHRAFFSSAPVDVHSFVGGWGSPVLDDLPSQQLRWTTSLAGAALPLPTLWVLTVRTLALRLVWFAWAIVGGFFLYLQGRRALLAVVVHWRRGDWAFARSKRRPHPSLDIPSAVASPQPAAPAAAVDAAEGAHERGADPQPAVGGTDVPDDQAQRAEAAEPKEG